MFKRLLPTLLLVTCTLVAQIAVAEDGYEMWLRYQPIAETGKLKEYQKQFGQIVVEGESPVLASAQAELERGLSGLLGKKVAVGKKLAKSGSLVIGTSASSPLIASLNLQERLAKVGPEGFIITATKVNSRNALVIAANSDAGVLYGAFHLLRLVQTQQSLANISLESAPRVQHRVVNHWDNLNRLVERGYGGLSLWDWGNLPEYKDPRYTDYARINASLGINGTVINNVNADPRILSDQFLVKVAALADVFRPYGIKMYLSINYDAPRGYGDLDTADPLDPRVQAWWNARTEKIYSYIPDFGGYLVKADSEGEPGPQGYGRNHADGANMLADALKPFGGVVFWRAFVYNADIGDRFRGAYDEFTPLDGKFRENVILQVKNGPIDFQPREPFSPLFGNMPKTNTMMEFQVTQEYFGFDKHLAYQGPLFTETLNTDTHAKGPGSTVGKILGGDVFNYTRTGMAAVINPGTTRNWTGHPFVQASWYAFGRLAWDYELTAEAIAEEWARMTFSNDRKFLDPVIAVMMESREAGVNYRSPLGLTHLYAQGHHYGPAPWHDKSGRADWTAAYYHRATKDGVGFNRTQSGSNALAQYHSAVRDVYANLETVPEDLLLWFHAVPWTHKMKSGNTLWDELVGKYYTGVEQVRDMQKHWDSIEGLIDAERFERVKALLKIQERDAVRWRDSCVLYFQSLSGMPIPAGYEKPAHSLEHYKSLERTHYVPEPWHPASNSRALK